MFSFGIFSDVHFAKNKEYGNRYCTLSTSKLRECINTYNNKKVDFVVNLGDLIDTNDNKSQDIDNLCSIRDIYYEYKGSRYNIIGNHDLESMSKLDFFNTLGIKNKNYYYSFDFSNYHFVVLDANFKENGTQYDSGNFDWTDTYILKEQQQWLIDDISKIKSSNIFIFIHENIDHRMYNDDIDPHIVKNASDIRSILEKSNKNIIVIQGHYHDGYYQQINGIHYVTIKAMCVGGNENDNAYSIVNVNEDKVFIEGFGFQPSLDILLNNFRKDY